MMTGAVELFFIWGMALVFGALGGVLAAHAVLRGRALILDPMKPTYEGPNGLKAYGDIKIQKPMSEASVRSIVLSEMTRAGKPRTPLRG